MPILTETTDTATELTVLDPDGLVTWIEAADPATKTWVESSRFGAGLGEILTLPGAEGNLAGILVGWGTPQARSRDRFHLAGIVPKLPDGTYRLNPEAVEMNVSQEVLGWLLAEYSFDRYRERGGRDVNLVCPDGVGADRVRAMAEAAALCQDLINTPARDMGPDELESAFLDLAQKYGAETTVIRGEELETGNFPMIAAVGAASHREPRLLDMTWGRADAPKVTIVGKGVCFDTGGLNIKPGASMGLMKKDMGGAATSLGLALMVMALGLDIRLRVLVPAVENAISGPAFRPGDILPSRKGLTVEVNNTDAEGRLVLADALALADEESPDLIISLATLTGAARVALGPDVPPFYTDDEDLAGSLAASAQSVADPLWRLPFWNPYEYMIEPGIADLDNAPAGGMAGSITAALFLRRFVEHSTYLHLDLYGWTPAAKPARPNGGAFQGARAIFDVLEERY